MRSSLWGCIAVVVALGALAVTPAYGQEAAAKAGQAGCCDTGCCEPNCGCGSCCGGAIVGCPEGGWVSPCPECNTGFLGGIEWTILRPHFRDNVAFTTANTAPGAAALNEDVFNHHYDSAPRIWLGWVGPNCFGGRIGWWFFDHASSTDSFTATATSAAATGSVRGGQPWGISALTTGTTLTATSNIRAYTLDAELMQQLSICKWRMNLGGGLRHASIAQSFGAVTTAAGGALTNALDVQNRFDGFGPTVFAEMRRPFGNSGLAFVSNVRGSFVYGDVGLRARQVNGLGGNPTFQTWDFSHEAGSISIGELQIGGEWSKPVGNANVVAQLLWEGQYWRGTGNAIGVGDDMGLMGVTLMFGITR